MAAHNLPELEQFSGEADQDILTWFKRFELFNPQPADDAPADIRRRHQSVPLYLTGRAFNVYDGLTALQKNDYEAIKTAVKERLDPGQHALLRRQEFLNLKRGPDESLVNFELKVTRAAAAAFADFPQQHRDLMAKEQFMRGIGNPAVQLHLLTHNPATIRGAVQLAEQYVQVQTVVKTSTLPEKDKSECTMVGMLRDPSEIGAPTHLDPASSRLGETAALAASVKGLVETVNKLTIQQQQELPKQEAMIEQQQAMMDKFRELLAVDHEEIPIQRGRGRYRGPYRGRGRGFRVPSSQGQPPQGTYGAPLGDNIGPPPDSYQPPPMNQGQGPLQYQRYHSQDRRQPLYENWAFTEARWGQPNGPQRDSWRSQRPFDGVCYHCNSYGGHLSADCPMWQSLN